MHRTLQPTLCFTASQDWRHRSLSSLLRLHCPPSSQHDLGYGIPAENELGVPPRVLDASRHNARSPPQ